MTLREFFEENPVCAVAFSGGVDSAVLLSAAAAYGRKTAAYFVRTVFQPVFELEDARETAGRLGVELRVLEADILAVPEVAANPADRCYYCKRALFTRLLEEAARDGLSHTLSPASRAIHRTSAFPMPHSRSGDRIPSSASARIPGRSPASSEALHPSTTTGNPSRAASSSSRVNSARLQ